MDKKEARRVEGYVRRVVFNSGEYYVFLVETEGKFSYDMVVGEFSGLTEGMYIEAVGQTVEHPKFGTQLKSTHIVQTTPRTKDALVRYLASGAFKGVGIKKAKQIVDHFGIQTREVIENHPERLREISKLSNCENLISQIKSVGVESKLLAWLAPFGVTRRKAAKISKHYNVQTTDQAASLVEAIKADPHFLCMDIAGVGFKTVDSYALEIGIAVNSPSRIKAGLLYVLDEKTAMGHCGIEAREFIRISTSLLGVNKDDVATGVKSLVEMQMIYVDDMELTSGPVRAVFKADLYEAEAFVAKKLAQMMTDSPCIEDLIEFEMNRPFSPLMYNPIAEVLDSSKESEDGFVVADSQSDAIRKICSQPVNVLTGGPGTGKTTIVKLLLRIIKETGKTALVAAPTGKAAKRASQATGEEVCTIHRMLKFEPSGGFMHNEETPLDCDVLIIDEFSMVDVRLMASLLRAVSKSTVLVMVGDVDQLPSVGSGKVLSDVINSGLVNVARLTEIFRQAAESRIIQFAYKVNAGVCPEDCDEDDLRVVSGAGENFVQKEVERALKEAVHSKGFGIDEIQILAPMRKGATGTEGLNEVGRNMLNRAEYRAKYQDENESPDAVIGKFERTIYIGDRVMQNKNNYVKEVFNGELGIVKSIDCKNETVSMELPEGILVEYNGDELEQIMPAWASTVHRFQGSECPCVILVLARGHHLLLKRNMAFTGATRASERLVVINESGALATACKTIDGEERVTMLKEFMKREELALELNEN